MSDIRVFTIFRSDMETPDHHETEVEASTTPDGEEVSEGHPHHHGGHHDHGHHSSRISNAVRDFVAGNLRY